MRQAHVFYHPGKGGFPGDDLGTNGAQVLLQSPPFCPHLFALSSSRQSSSVALPHTFVRKKGAGPALPGIITVEAAPALLVLQSWAPRTPLLCSFVTEQG